MNENRGTGTERDTDEGAGVVRGSLTFQLRSQRSEIMSPANAQGKSFLGSGNGMCKGPGAGPGFSTSAPLTFEAGYLCRGGHPVYQPVFSRTPGIYPLDPSGNPHQL